MNRPILAALLVATALSSSLAWADPKDDHAGGGQQGHGQQGQQGQGGRPAQAQRQVQRQPRQQAQRQPQTQAQRQPQQQVQRSYQAQGRPQAQAQARPQAQALVQRRGAAAAGRGFSYGGRRHEQIRGPSYSYPQGYGYRRWGVGQDLPRLFLNSLYFFDAFGDYDISPPPYGYHWVRYGSDLLLVNDRSGRIRQVIYGVFY